MVYINEKFEFSEFVLGFLFVACDKEFWSEANVNPVWVQYEPVGMSSEIHLYPFLL